MAGPIFVLDPKLDEDTFPLVDLELSTVRLMNNKHFPWLILIPQKNGLKEVIDLDKAERMLLMDEISLVSKIMQMHFAPQKLNVAALGNVVSQLHIHIIARFESDMAWPRPVFGEASEPYPEDQRDDLIQQLKELFA